MMYRVRVERWRKPGTWYMTKGNDCKECRFETRQDAQRAIGKRKYNHYPSGCSYYIEEVEDAD